MKRLNTLTFKQLRTLEAVETTGSLTGAAELMGLTTPAVHSQMKTLEDNFGCPMILRAGSRQFCLTPQGVALLAAHRKCVAALHGAVRQIEALSKGLSGTMVLGVVSTGKYFAPQLVATLNKAYPDIEVILKIGNRTEIIAALTDNTIDLAIMGRPPREPVVAATVIGDHPHALIVSPGHRLATADGIGPQDILQETIILREEGSGTRILTTRFLDRIGQGQGYSSIVMGSNETIKQAVIAGLGIAIISRHTVTEEIHSGRLVEVRTPELPILRTWFLIHPAATELSGATQVIMDFINSAKGSFLPN